MIVDEQIRKAKEEKQAIKCVAWDLDYTIWNGVLLEDDKVSLRNGIVETLRELDQRGILNSIASRNEYDLAMAKLQEFGLAEYFLYPEINWNSKSTSIRSIAKSLNISLDTFAFIDDQAFERAEVAHELPEIMCIDADNLNQILDMAEMKPRFITSESKLRRQMYLSDIARNKAEEEFSEPNESFLSTLDMIFRIKSAEEGDLQRAEELTVRTHQLNTTGYTYSFDELDEFITSDDHLLLVASLEDKFGTYGTIGLGLVELDKEFWTVKLLLMSCRVMSRGVGTIMMNYLMGRAKKAGVCLRAEFVPNGRNRMMYITYKFTGFREVREEGGLIVLENDLTQIQPLPDYLQIHICD
jgi:FkbH-like protein